MLLVRPAFVALMKTKWRTPPLSLLRHAAVVAEHAVVTGLHHSLSALRATSRAFGGVYALCSRHFYHSECVMRTVWYIFWPLPHSGEVGVSFYRDLAPPPASARPAEIKCLSNRGFLLILRVPIRAAEAPESTTDESRPRTGSPSVPGVLASLPGWLR